MAENPNQAPEVEGYDNFEKIGVGGTSTVWKARQISLGRVVAIKIISEAMTSDDESIDQIQSEARIAGCLDHPGIVRIYDAFYRNGIFCIVMEYVNGETLTNRIARLGSLSEHECLCIAERVAEALDYAWNSGKIVHCDIKPDNILIDVDGTIKVADMGLSRGIGGIQTRKKIKENSDCEVTVFGTPSYLSPEQAMGETNLTIQSDMYSLGATLFHMATGKRLFNSASENDAIQMQVTHSYYDPMDIAPGLSPHFCDLIERLLAKKPEERYNSWQDFIRDAKCVHEGREPVYGPIDRAVSESTVALGRARLSLRRRKALWFLFPAIKKEGLRFSGTELTAIFRHRIEQTVKHLRTIFPEFKWKTKRINSVWMLFFAILLFAGVAVLTAVLSSEMGRDSACDDPVLINSINKMASTIESNFKRTGDCSAALREYDNLINLHGIASKTRRRFSIRRKEISAVMNARINGILSDLSHRAELANESAGPKSAADVFLNYNGELADETAEVRNRKAKSYLNGSRRTTK